MLWEDDIFFRELEKGHKYEERVAIILEHLGCDVERQEKSVRDTHDEISSYKDEVDLVVDGYNLEIKSRDLKFTSHKDFPYNTIMIDTVSGWDQKSIKPFSILCISQVTNAIISIRSSTQDRWKTVKRWDHVRKIHDTFYVADKRLWRTVWPL